MQKILSLLTLGALCHGAVAEQASLLVYRVWEEGAEPYISRVLVTPDYVRLDEGAGGGYTLLDRQQEILYNVSPEERTVLVMNPTGTVPEDDSGLILDQEIKPDDKAPSIAGQRPTDVRLFANGELCGELVVVEGLMPEAVDGLIELKQVLARIQAATLEAMPLDMRTPCDLATNVYAPDRSLRFGLPIQERAAGRSQSLVDFTAEFEADDATFAVPADFDRRALFGP